MTIKHIQGEAGKRLEEIIQELDSKIVKVGYFSTARYPDGKPVAGVAVVQEYGSITRRIPARATFGPAIKHGRPMQRDAIAAAVRRALAGAQTVEQGLAQLGAAVVGDIQTAISELQTPPLRPSTIARKNGVPKPLVDSGLMLQSVTHVVENK